MAKKEVAKKEGVTDITNSSLKYTYKEGWTGNLITANVRWKPETISGKIKTAASRTIAQKLGWYCPTIYNDLGGFRKSDKTLSRRIKWDYCIIKPLTQPEIKKFTDSLKRILKAKDLHVHVHNSKNYRGTICVYMREDACDC